MALSDDVSYAVRRAALLAPLVGVSTVLAFGLSFKTASGDKKFLELALGMTWLAFVLTRPRAAFLGLLVLGASVLPYGSLQTTVAGHVTDVVEITLFGLVAVWCVARGLGRERLESRFAPAVGLLLLAVFMGTVVGQSRGSSGHDLFGLIKPWCYYVLAIPLASWFADEQHRELLQRWVVGVCVLGSALTLFVVATGVKLPFVGTRPFGVGTLGVTAVGIERVRPDLVALLVLATLLVAADITVKGITLARVATLVLFMLMHVLTFTRSTWAPLLLAFGLLTVLHPGPRKALRGLRRGLFALLAAAVLLLAANSGAFGETGRAAALRAASIVNPQVLNETSYTDRASENQTALAALRRHPLTGVGLAQLYGARRLEYLPDPPRLVYVDRSFVHNQYLYAWLQLGILGPLAFLVLGAIAVRGSREALQRLSPLHSARCLAAALALLVYLLQFLLQTTMLYPANILAVITAMTLAVPSRSRLADQPLR